MKNIRKVTIYLLLVIFLLSGCETRKQDSSKTQLSPENPVNLSVWVYYNGAQLESFHSLVEQFNQTAGKEKGIYVEVSSHGTINELTDKVMATQEEVGGGKIPNIFSAYADTAYKIDNMGMLADLSKYITKEEQDQYIQSYIEEGRFCHDGSLKIFPVAKSVEIFMLNKTDWDKFASQTGTSPQDFSTIEGLVEVAQKYYEWTDGLTQVPNDGKAFFGRDAMANYFFTGAMQQGHELITIKNKEVIVDFDQEVINKLWDYYYIPYIKGYFASIGRFRSDDVKTGSIISFVGSSAGATFFPEQVILSDCERYPIEMEVFQTPKFADGENYDVQQGAGMVVTKGTEQEIEASVEFLKWFTYPERNITFSVDSGYLPVTKAANQIDAIFQSKPEISEPMKRILTVGIETVNEKSLFTPNAFDESSKVRDILNNSLENLAKEDREIVVERLRLGMSLDRAVSGFTTDAYFDTWYQRVLQEIEDSTT